MTFAANFTGGSPLVVKRFPSSNVKEACFVTVQVDDYKDLFNVPVTISDMATQKTLHTFVVNSKYGFHNVVCLEGVPTDVELQAKVIIDVYSSAVSYKNDARPQMALYLDRNTKKYTATAFNKKPKNVYFNANCMSTQADSKMIDKNFKVAPGEQVPIFNLCGVIDGAYDIISLGMEDFDGVMVESQDFSIHYSKSTFHQMKKTTFHHARVGDEDSHLELRF